MFWKHATLLYLYLIIFYLEVKCRAYALRLYKRFSWPIKHTEIFLPDVNGRSA